MRARGLLRHVVIVIALASLGSGGASAHAVPSTNGEQAPEIAADQGFRPTVLTRLDPQGTKPEYQGIKPEYTESPGASGPFATLQREATDGPLWAKWRTVQKDIESEHRILALCRADRQNCPSAAAAVFLTIIDTARGREGRARIGWVNRSINLAIRPMSDFARFGVPDVWSAPLATLAAGAGDCEDYAIAKYVALREAGVREEDLRLMIVRDAKVREDHALVTARFEGRWLVLDNRWLALAEDTELPRFDPLFSVGPEGVSRLVTAPEQMDRGARERVSRR